MILDPGFPTHPKTEEVDREIGPIGVVAVVTLFCFAHSTKRWEWRFESREQLLKKFKAMTRTWALIEPEQLLSVLGDTFLDLDEDGLGFQIHDFEEHNWKLVRAWRNAKKSADVRKAKREDSSSELKPKKAAPSSKLKSKKTSTSSELKPKNGPPSSERKGREGKGRERRYPPLPPRWGERMDEMIFRRASNRRLRLQIIRTWAQAPRRTSARPHRPSNSRTRSGMRRACTCPRRRLSR